MIFALYAPHSPSSLQMLEGVQKLVDPPQVHDLRRRGRHQAPRSSQASGVSGVPAGVALLAGRPAPLYTGPVA